MKCRIALAALLIVGSAFIVPRLKADEDAALKKSWIAPGKCVYCGFDDDVKNCTCVATEE